MKITIIAIGSRGDTQPYIALAVGLQQAGHQVRVCAGDNFRDFVTGYGLDFAPLGVDIQQFINQRVPEVLETGRNALQAVRTIAAESMAYIDQMWAGVRDACADADLIGANMLGFGAACIAEQRHIPMVLLHSTPMIGRTHHAPAMLFPFQRDMGRVFNALSHDLTEFALRQLLRTPINHWRSAAGMPPLPRFGWRFDALPNLSVPMLYAHSPAVLPRPDDWPSDWQVTGYWFLDAQADWKPPAELVAFLEAGTPPFYIGFGSMANRQPARMTHIVLEALAKSGQRGILATGWGGLSAADLPDHVFLLESIPHDWLFPRVAGVVHHGGVGTTAAGLRAGVSSVIVPHFGDQYFWGERVYRLGIGVRPIPHSRLTVDRLANAFQEISANAGMRQRSAALGATIRAEKGVENAVRLIESHAH